MTVLGRQLSVWNLRGNAMPASEFTKALTKRVAKGQYDIVIIDPMYKLMEGDENSNSDMAKLVNNFDKIVKRLGLSLVVSSHFAKGRQNHKEPQERTSGAGVFARDPDAIVTLTKKGRHSNEYDVDYSLRGFPQPVSKIATFAYPIHHVREKTEADVTQPKKQKSAKRVELSLGDIRQALAELKAANPDVKVTKVALAEQCGKSRRTVHRTLKVERVELVDGELVPKE